MTSTEQRPKTVMPHWKEYFGKLNCHGFSDLSNAQRRQVTYIWASFLLVFTGCLAYAIVMTSLEFYWNPIITTTRYMSVPAIDFPTVYICTEDQIDASKLDPYTEDKLKNATQLIYGGPQVDY